MKRNLPKKLLSLLLSGMLVVTGLDVTTVRAAEPSASVETEAETTSSESQAIAETASNASQNETPTESQAVAEAASDESQVVTESDTDESQAAMESETNESQAVTESNADESQTETKSDADEPQTVTETASDESQNATESNIDEPQTETESVTGESQTEAESVTDESQTETESVTDESQTESETETETETLPSFSLFEVNPLYADLIDASQAEEQFEGKALLAEPREEASCQTLEEAAAHLREKMIAREGTVVINMPSDVVMKYTFGTFFDKVFDIACEYSDNCTGQEGDALRWATKTRGIDGNGNGDGTYHLVFTITYHSTAAQEEALTTKVNNALKELNLDGKSDYEKVRAIHDYICDHVNYDYSLTKYSAYDALCTGESVCQGYAVLFYRMCKDAGLSVRIISGIGNGGDHGWNIVKISDNARAAGQYYNVDCTWDGQSDKTHHSYFLKCDADFVNHTRDAEYNTAEFLAAFPMAEASYILSNGMNVPNIEHLITKYVADGEDVDMYTTTDGKPRVIAIIQTTCTRSQATVRDMATNNFGDVDLYVISGATVSAESKADLKNFISKYAPNNSHLTFGFNASQQKEVMKPVIPGGPPVLQWETTYLWDSYLDLAKEHLGWAGNERTPTLIYLDANDKVQHMTYGQQTAAGIKNNLKAYCGSEAGSEDTSAYLINYELNGGTNHTGNPSAYTASSDPITLLDPVKEGYTFLGWYTDQEMTKKITQITSQNTGNLTLYAKWEASAQKPENPDGFPEIDMNLTDGNILVGISGAYATETADTILDRLNEIRLEACREGVINPETNQPLTEADYTPLKWSSDLEAIARLRAAEAALRPAHDRPNGQKWSTVKTTNNEHSWAENLAWNSSDLMSGIEQWYKEKIDWVNHTGGQTGHYESIIKPTYKYVAVSAFKLPEGYIYPVCVAQEFSSQASLDSQKNDFAGNCMQGIEIAGSAVSKLAFSDNSPLSLKTGSSHKLGLNATVGFEAFNSKTNCTGPVQDGAVWTSSDETIAAVDDKGQITTFKDGTVTITAAVGTITAELTVKVSENAEEPDPAYTITYILDDGTNHADNPDSYTANTETITLKAPAKEGYTFDGWYTDAAMTNKITQITKDNTGNLTLYAKWTKNQTSDDSDTKPGDSDTTVEPKYTVTFNMNGHGSAPQSITDIQSGELIQKPADPTAQGYRFDGWYKDSSCSTAWNFNTDKVTADTTLYAKWVKLDAPADEDVSKYPADQRKDLKAAGAKIAEIKSKVYDGSPYTPTVKVTASDNGKQITLTEGVDYRVLYTNNVVPGTAKVTVRGNGTYKGEITKEFQITKKPLKDLNIVAGGMSADAKTDNLPVYIYDGAVELVKGTDYTLSNLTDVKGSSAKVTATAAKSSKYYEGSVTTKVTLYKADADKIINADNVTLSAKSVPFTGKAVTSVVPTVKIGNVTLEKNKQYKVQYKDNTKAGTALVIITGKGQYKGKVVKSFTIEPSKSKFTVSSISDKTYNGKLQKPSVTVKDGTKKLKVNRDYTVTYAKNLSAGKATVTITGIGNYAGSAPVTTTFTIKSQKISKASVKGTVSKGITLTYNKKPLVEGVDYKLTYGAVKNGKTQVTITGIGDFTDKKTKMFKN